MTHKVESYLVSAGILPRMSGNVHITYNTMEIESIKKCSFFPFRTILLSVVSLLNEPNTFSPANVDASVMFRRWKESKGKDKEYEHIIRCERISPGV